MKEQRGFLSMLKLGIILALYATAACVMLAFVYSGTEKIIAQRQQADTEAALKELFPDALSFREIQNINSSDPAVTVENGYEAIKDDMSIGAILQLSRASYGGPIKLLTGVSVDGVITGVRILEHQETPGLGANAGSPSYFVDRARGITFYGQFAGKKANDPFEIKNDVSAITAATITSRAVTDAVKAAGISVASWYDSTNAKASGDKK